MLPTIPECLGKLNSMLESSPSGQHLPQSGRDEKRSTTPLSAVRNS